MKYLSVQVANSLQTKVPSDNTTKSKFVFFSFNSSVIDTLCATKSDGTGNLVLLRMNTVTGANLLRELLSELQKKLVEDFAIVVSTGEENDIALSSEMRSRLHAWGRQSVLVYEGKCPAF